MRNRTNEPLTNEQLQQVAPSIFAGQAHDSRSGRYTFVPTLSVIDGLREAGFAPVAVSQSLSRIAGTELFTKHEIRFRSIGESLVQVGDTAVEAVLVNSHDGTSTYRISLGAYRLACLNGMIVSERLAESVTIRHSGNVIDRIVQETTKLIELAPVVVNAIKTWKQIELTAPEQNLLAQSALALRFEDNAPITADKLLQPRRSADSGNDLWTVFNKVQEGIVRGGFKYVTPASNDENGNYIPSRRSRTREVKGIDQNSRLNRELWSLAEGMAKIKQAA